jgi:hypothetical protein
MAASTRFWLSFGTLLAVPLAFALLGSGELRGSLQYVLPNYLWLAFPHVVLAALAVSPVHRSAPLLLGLAALNAVLLAFWLWVRFAVPLHESGLAWVLYLPLGVAELLVAGLVGFGLRRWRKARTVGA